MTVNVDGTSGYLMKRTRYKIFNVHQAKGDSQQGHMRKRESNNGKLDKKDDKDGKGKELIHHDLLSADKKDKDAKKDVEDKNGGESGELECFEID